MWPSSRYWKHANSQDGRDLAKFAYEATCRTAFDQPGFCVLAFDAGLSSQEFRQQLVTLKQTLEAIHRAKTKQGLVYVSATRFDQQESTKFHLDGGPAESLLLLGYEPTTVRSEIAIADYAKCASDLGLSASEFLREFNPMFARGLEQLKPYITHLDAFDEQHYNIVCINNSCVDNATTNTGLQGIHWQGVLHTATIPHKDEQARRVINSLMIAKANEATQDTVSSEELDDFLTSTAVRRRGYDKQHLADDE